MVGGFVIGFILWDLRSLERDRRTLAERRRREREREGN